MIEVIVGAAIISTSLVGVILVFGGLTRLAQENLRYLQASYLLEETAEVVRLFRDTGWPTMANLNPATTYYLQFAGGRWATSTTPSLIDGAFARTFSVTPVNRDANDNIAQAGTNDPNTKLVNVSVAWLQGGATTTRAASFYLTNLFDS